MAATDTAIDSVEFSDVTAPYGLLAWRPEGLASE